MTEDTVSTKSGREAGSRAVRVSVVIPTFARPDGLRSCLEGLAATTLERDTMEVIVVDDGGGDGAEQVAADFAARLPVRAIRKPNGGPASARNAGASIASGRFLAFIDDDCVPAHDWLPNLLTVLEAQPGVLAGGPVINGLPDDPFAAASQRIATYVARHYADGRGRERFFTTNNFALASERFAELGGFDTSIPSWTAEDKEFCDRWRDRGYEMAWAASARVHHAHALSLRAFIRQHYDYGRGILAFRMRRKRIDKKIVPESAGFYGGLVFDPLIRGPRKGAARQVLLLMLSQAATLAGAVAAAVRRETRARPSEAPAAPPVSSAEST
jgi:GT2 family glycosyltransferase